MYVIQLVPTKRGIITLSTFLYSFCFICLMHNCSCQWWPMGSKIVGKFLNCSILINSERKLFPNDFFHIFHFYSTFPLTQRSLGEHPAAMQRGCANNSANVSILLYIISLSLFLQQFNQIAHGHGVSTYDVIRWWKPLAKIQQSIVTHVMDRTFIVDKHLHLNGNPAQSVR